MPGIIYLIGCDGPERYVGSTKRTLAKRWSLHKAGYNRWKVGKARRCMSVDLFDKYGLEACWINVLEEVSDDAQLSERERHWIENTEGCVNRCMPARSYEERLEIAKVRWATMSEEDKRLRNDYVNEWKRANRDRIKLYPSSTLTPEQKARKIEKQRERRAKLKAEPSV